MLVSKRIPAQRSGGYQRWSPPDVARDKVIRLESAGAERRLAPEVEPSTWKRESLEEQVVANIRAGRYATGVSARQLENIVRDAAREGRENGFNAGFVKGREEGFAEGKAEGLEKGRQLIEDAATRLAALLDSLQEPLREQRAELGVTMFEIVEKIARSVVRSELVLNPESIKHVVDEALAALPLGARNVRVFVCGADVHLLQNAYRGQPECSLLVDDSLEPGSCRVESADSLVEYTVSQRFEEMLRQLLPHRHNPVAAPVSGVDSSAARPEFYDEL